MKCVRQRCQAAPGRVASIAATRPLWSSLTTSCTPERPRSTRSRRNTVQAAASSAVKTSRPRISRWPSAFTALATTQADLAVRPSSRTLTARASSHRYGVGALVERPASGRRRPLSRGSRPSPGLALRDALDASVLTRPSTRRVETPRTSHSATTARGRVRRVARAPAASRGSRSRCAASEPPGRRYRRACRRAARGNRCGGSRARPNARGKRRRTERRPRRP